MRILVLGADGYLGWPTAMALCARGHEVCVVDNYLRRKLASETDSDPLLSGPLLPERTALFEHVTGTAMQVVIGDCSEFDFVAGVVQHFAPEALVHFAEQPSAPYSMMGFEQARITLSNNISTTFNVIWAILQHAPDCHIIKLGTLGEYGTPNIDIEEGWIEIEHKKRRDKFLFPRQGQSLYHTTKILDTDLLWFYVRTYQLRVTDIMQGPVYGFSTKETELHPGLISNFHYDDIFGTVVNRFLVQAVIGVPLTVYGQGHQARGYINIRDTAECIALVASNPPPKGELKILNQFTETFTVSALAENVRRAATLLKLDVQIQHIDNPRKEAHQHYYNPMHHRFDALGLQPNLLTDEAIARMLELILPYRDRVVMKRIKPRVWWNHC